MFRLAKRAALHVCKALGLFHLARWWTRHAVCVLGYHGSWRLRDGSHGDAQFMRRETFASRLDLLQRQGYVIRPLHEVIDALSAGETLPRRVVVITIDDGWYGTYADMLPALEARGIPATLFCDTAHLQYGQPIPHVLARYLRARCVSTESAEARVAFEQAIDTTRSLDARTQALADYIRVTGIESAPFVESDGFRYMTPDELRDLQARGIDVQLHTHHHSLHDFSPSRIRDEIERNRRELAAILGDDRVRTHFCYPSGVTQVKAGETLRELGVTTACGTTPGLVRQRTDRYNLPRYLDGDHVSRIEFEAWVSGFAELVRRGIAVLRAWWPRATVRRSGYAISDMPSGRNRALASPPASS